MFSEVKEEQKTLRAIPQGHMEKMQWIFERTAHIVGRTAFLQDRLGLAKARCYSRKRQIKEPRCRL